MRAQIKMNSNQLREHIQRLNQQERIETEQRRQKALDRIQQLREELKYKNKETARCQKEYF